MSIREVIDAMERWLPNPSYRFVGGPKDGQFLTVELYERPDGLVLPHIWNVVERLPLPLPSWRELKDGPPTDTLAVTRHRYRFVQTGGMDQGHYEWIPQ